MKKRIIFVDDEASVLLALRRMLHSMRNDWEMIFAASGKEALDILANKPVDVVVSDMRMPGMDGAELLRKTMELYPGIVRIILSGYSDEEMVLRSVKSAHQFVPKPCDSKILKMTIAHSCMLRESLNDQNLQNVVTGIKTLPSLPSLYEDMINEMESADPSLKIITDIISRDLSMTARVLQLVNSAFFGLASKITHPRQAVALLGINTLRALVLNVHFFSAFQQVSGNFSFERLWQHSLQVGNLARFIVHSEMSDSKLEEKAMVAGILHDIGKLPLLELPGHYGRLRAFCSKNQCNPVEAEYQLLGTSHAEVGAYLLSLWGLPDTIIEPILFHHRPSMVKENEFSVLTAVHVANTLIERETNPEIRLEIDNFDYVYLSNVKMLPKLSKWQADYKEIMEMNFYAEKNTSGR